MVLRQHCQGWGYFWDTVGRNWPERPTGTLPGPIKTPCLFPRRLCVSFTPTWVLSAGPLDRLAVSPTSSGVAPRPHDPTRPWVLLTVAPSLGAHQLLDRPIRARPLSRTLAPAPARSPLAILSLLPVRLLLPSLHPPAHGTLSSLMHGPGVSTQSPVTTYHGPKSPDKAGFRYRSQMQQREGRPGEAKLPKTGSGPQTLVLWPTSSPTSLPTVALSSSLASAQPSPSGLPEGRLLSSPNKLGQSHTLLRRILV